MGGFDPYSNSKGCAEMVTSAYRSSFFSAVANAGRPVALASARAGNVIGGGDWAADRLVPDILKAFASGKPAFIRNPDAIRPWQHVLEPLRGYLTLAERLHTDGQAFAEAFNFGPHSEDARAVQWIAQRMAQQWQDGARWQVDGGVHPHEAHYLKLDISKAGQRLAWQPCLSLDDALALTVAWERCRLRPSSDLRAFTLDQIQTYQQHALGLVPTLTH
jgi:CDP-glucose 4,6-dehydratase